MRYLFFPLVMTFTLGTAVAGLSRGVHPTLLLAGILVVAWIALTVAERTLPFRADWNRTRGDVGTDLAHNLANTAGFEIAKAILIVSLAPVAAFVSGGLPFVAWPHHWPLLAQAALALLINEFAQYGVHRLAHERGDSLLWRLHAVHHGPRRVYWFNAGREHPLTSTLFVGAGLCPLLVLGAGQEALALFALSTAVLGYFQHVNMDLRLGPLNWIFSGAELHRWHHSTNPAQGNRNYGDNLVICDLIFGTLYRPPTPEVPEVGIAALPDYPEGWVAQVKLPFQSGSASGSASWSARGPHRGRGRQAVVGAKAAEVVPSKAGVST